MEYTVHWYHHSPIVITIQDTFKGRHEAEQNAVKENQ